MKAILLFLGALAFLVACNSNASRSDAVAALLELSATWYDIAVFEKPTEEQQQKLDKVVGVYEEISKYDTQTIRMGIVSYLKKHPRDLSVKTAKQKKDMKELHGCIEIAPKAATNIKILNRYLFAVPESIIYPVYFDNNIPKLAPRSAIAARDGSHYDDYLKEFDKFASLYSRKKSRHR
jgi:hypothetical protein